MMPKYGLDTWHTAENAKIDIVFVHGLRGQRERTWTKNGVTWPRDILPIDIKDSRILSFGYDSGIVHSDTAEVTQGSIVGDAQSLCALLKGERSSPETENRPIILVAHSLGGIVCAELVVIGERAASGDSVHEISRCIMGMIFLGTPFGGAHLAKWADLIRRVFHFAKKTDQNTLKTLKENSTDLRDIVMGFSEVIRKRNATKRKVKIVFFHETLDTYGSRVVDEQSASLPGIGETLPIRANHSDICKYSSRDDNGYKIVRAKLIDIIAGQTDEKHSESKQTTINNYDKVINQAAGDINIGSQTFTF